MPHHAIEKLMDISITLADLTNSPDLATQIPAYLTRMLNVEPVTLAIVRNADGENGAQVILLGSSGALADESSLQHAVLQIHTKGTAAKDTPTLRFSGGHDTTSSVVNLGDVPGYPRAVVLTRVLDSEHRVYLVVHQAGDEASLSPSLNDALIHITNQLGKLLSCLLAWQASPEILGATFERLTEREWIVLRGLNSEDGEKQLADRLGLSPHTLHSHIKSIYRKVGVQGRLPLLLRLNAAVRELRAASVSAATVTEPSRRSVNRPVAYAV